jgi:hypothetical protein
MYFSGVNITNTILNDVFIHFSKYKVNYVHLSRKIQTTIMIMCVQTNELSTSEVYFFKNRISMLIIEY